MTGPVGGSGIRAEAVERAVEAAAEAIYRAWTGGMRAVPFAESAYHERYVEAGRDAVAAAVPVLLEAAAAEIHHASNRMLDAQSVDDAARSPYRSGYMNGLIDGARLAEIVVNPALITDDITDRLLSKYVRRLAVEWTEGNADA